MRYDRGAVMRRHPSPLSRRAAPRPRMELRAMLADGMGGGEDQAGDRRQDGGVNHTGEEAK
jgi:hypothetical protein